MLTKRYINIKLLALSVSMLMFIGITTLSAGPKEDLLKQYNTATELYNKGVYLSAYNLFQSILPKAKEIKSNIEPEIQGYLTLISIESGHPAMEANYRTMEENYSESSMITLVRFSYAGKLFDNESYNKSIVIFEKLDPSHLDSKYKNEFYFKLGYAFFKTGNTNMALDYMHKAADGPFDGFTNIATYYLAHTYYLTRDFKKAISLFEKIDNDPRFSLLSKYYILESQFMTGNHNYVTTHGENLYNQLEGELQTKSARLISESFFATNNTQKARFYFERYSLSKNMLSRNELYYAGMLAYSQDKYEEAIELFKQVTSVSDSLSQNAAYHLGRCYIEIKNKFEALNSFKLAADGSHDLTIKEDAMFNYAKLSFDLNSDIAPFKRYLDTYSPGQVKFNEIQNYIANSYLVNQDYKSAIDVLRSIKNPSTADIINIQKATFLRGMQLISLGAYRDAIPMFELSLANGSYNNNLSNVAKFWLAEAYFRNNQLRRSVEINHELATTNYEFKGNQEYPASFYNLAYGYFKLGEYSKAEEWFKKYINLPRGQITYFDEALARLGDSYFMQRKYQEAINSYSIVSTGNKKIKQYTQYQMAVVTGLTGNENEKASLLKELSKENLEKQLYPEVLYELARTLIQTGDDQQATDYLAELIQKFPKTTYYPKSLLELGLVNLNKGNYQTAIGYYKQILTEAPQSPESQSAIAGLENIYKEQGRAQEFLDYIDGLGLSQTRSTSERELIVFSSAEKQFISGNYPAAITSLNKFLKEYPDGEKSAQAWFYLGESYQKTSKPELAMDSFLKVMEIGEESFTELATLNYAKISYNLQNYNQAANAYSSLTRIAKLGNNMKEARLGLMNSYFMDKQYKNAIAEADKAITLDISENEKERTKYVKAKSYYLLGDRATSMTYLKELSNNKITPEGAESTYLIISDAFDKGDFQKVEKEVYDFADSRTPQSYWLAKSYILLGDTFAERGNWEQAEATYNSILESYSSQSKDDIEEQLKMRLAKIEEIKKQTNENL
ncbi:MAG: tetratricopeptide repeat protein [Bacteroidales bacterium]